MIDLPISEKQATSIREATGRVNVWHGAIRSSKTVASLLRWLIYVASAPWGGQLVVVGRTRESIARNVFGPLQDPSLFGDLVHQVSYTAGAPTARILGRTVYVIGASDSKAEKVIRGLTVAGAYVDEITVIPEEFFTQLLGRMSVPGAQLFGTTNPDNPAHWLKRKFLDRLAELADWRAWHFKLADNPSLTSEYIESISREFTGLWHRRFIDGEWVAAEGAIYDMWDPDKHVVDWENLPHMERLLALGLDFGTNHATSGIILGLSKEHGPDRALSRLYLVDEYRYDSSVTGHRLAPSQQADRFKKWLKQSHLPYATDLTPEVIFADQAAADFRQELWTKDIYTRPAVKDVSYGIGLIASLLCEHHLAASNRCQGFIQEAPGYSWDPKATERGEDAPIKVADDSCDAARYAIASAEMQWRGQIDWALAA